MRELNWTPGQLAEVSLLGDGVSAAAGMYPATIAEFSGKRVRLCAGLPVRGGAAVRLEWNGQLLLGQVLNIEPDGFWIEIHHMLLDSDGAGWHKTGWQRG